MNSSHSTTDKSIVLVGLMGAGKTCIGRRLASRTGLPFVDADDEIAKAADCTVEEIFERYGEQAFRDCERKVISRLMDEGPKIVATGGGAFMDPETRTRIKQSGISVWLRAELDILVERTGRRGGRPLLKNGDPASILGKLMEERYPVYEEADIVVDSGDVPPDVTVANVEKAIEAFNAPAEAGQAL